MKNSSRRDFLKNSIFASSSLLIPAFLKAGAPNYLMNKGRNGRKLVVIQLSGGNDGLNTVVPYQNDIYYKLRPTINIGQQEVLKLNDELGLHPSLKPLRSLYDDGLLSIINNVGYPNPDRSHFRSMDIWQTASDSNEFLSTGWLGRYMDAFGSVVEPHQVLEMDDTMSLALKGANHNGYAVGNIKQLKKGASNKFLKAVVDHHDHAHEGNTAYLYRTLADTFESADYLHDQSQVYSTSSTYPSSAFGKSLKQTAELIISGADTSVYYVSMGGFDTHANQLGQQSKLLKKYADGVAVFMKDLKANGMLDDVLVMTFSEFGRRVKQNASRGTDHGTASNVFLMGGGLKKPGFYNNGPDLSNLDNGDLKYSIDFRRIYASLLNDWLGVDNRMVLGKEFATLGVC